MGNYYTGVILGWHMSDFFNSDTRLFNKRLGLSSCWGLGVCKKGTIN